MNGIMQVFYYVLRIGPIKSELHHFWGKNYPIMFASSVNVFIYFLYIFMEHSNASMLPVPYVTCSFVLLYKETYTQQIIITITTIMRSMQI